MSGRAASVGVVETNDVVFAQVGAGLYFNQFQIDGAGVLQAMLHTQRNVGGLVFG